MNRVRIDATLSFVIAEAFAAHVESSAALAMNNTALGFEEPLVTDTPRPFPEQCARIHERINVFLGAEDVSERAKSVQKQMRIALDVIEQALDQYRWVALFDVGYGGIVDKILTVTPVYQSFLLHTMVARTVLCY